MAEPAPLERRLPPEDRATADALLEGFLDYVTERGLTLYPAQEEAILELFSGASVILNTPTGSGKSLVAAACHYRALARGERSFYTAPIKALVSEKFFALCRDFGADNVGMMTGDASVNRDAPIVCCTAEILSNLALREGAATDVDHVVMDEFHYYSDRDRGVAWQIPLLCLPQARFLLMSATLGETELFRDEIETRTGERAAIVKSAERPVPLDFDYRTTPLHETIGDLLEAGRAPIYIVHFSQRAAAEQAQNLMSIDFLSKEQKNEIKRELGGFAFDSPFGKQLRRFVRHGVGVHHAGMLPKYRLLVERLAQQGMLKLICGTDTLGVGVNVPIRSVLFTKLCKYDGEKTRILTVRDFKQIAGRAGRKGFDEQGSVVAQAPEHVIENMTMEQKAAGDAKKLRKLKRKKPPDRGYAHWDEGTFERLIASEPEPLSSSFHVSHAMLLHLFERPGNGCAALKELIRGCHDGPTLKRRHGRTAIAMLRSLRDAGVVEFLGEPDADGRVIRVNDHLQEDFSLNQALSLWVLDAIALLERDDPEYALDVLSLVEATLENPMPVLLAQLDKLKGDLIASLKAEGVEYEQRMEELEKVEYPKPRAELIYESYNEFARKHPWVGENIRPKSIARDMYEKAASFREYVKEYGLARSEGVLLRYLSDAYKALEQTVPEDDKSDEVYDLCDWLGAIVRQVDSSLIDEWERLRDPEQIVSNAAEEPAEYVPRALTDDDKAFEILVRNELFRVVRLLARDDLEGAAELVEADGDRWTADRLADALAPYRDEHDAIRIDADARAPRHVRIEKDGRRWRVEQTLWDPRQDGDFFLDVTLDLDRADEERRPVLQLAALRRR